MQLFSVLEADKTFLYLQGMSTIHTRLKEARLKAGPGGTVLSMQQAATAIGVKWQTIQNWEKGKGAPKRTRLKKVASVYGVDPEHLLFGSSKAQGLPAGYGDLDTGALEWAYAFQKLDQAQRARWNIYRLLAVSGVSDEDVLRTLLKGKLPPDSIDVPADETTGSPVAVIQPSGLPKRTLQRGGPTNPKHSRKKGDK